MRNILLLILSVGLLTSSRQIDRPTLKDAFKDKYLMGVAINRGQIHQRNQDQHQLITEQFNSLTPENDMKWMNIHPEQEKYNWEHADAYVAMAQENDMFAIGHTLVWHSQLAGWVFKTESGDTIDAAELESRMKNHIHTIVGRYKGKIKGWDVVNEALNDDGTMRNSLFYQIAGDAFIENAFKFAHEADPEAELYYNDYSMTNPAKRDGAIRIVKNLQSKGIKIDGIGMQGHWGLGYPSMEEIEAAIVKYAELGVKVMITELDVTALPSPWQMPTADVSVRFANNPTMNPYPDGLPDSVQVQLAERYAEIFELFNKHADKISRVTFWGLHDGLSWKNNFPIRGRTDYTLLFDRNMKPKKAFDAVVATTQK